MKTFFTLTLLIVFLSSATFVFAKPKDKVLKLNRGQIQSSINKAGKVLDLDDVNEKGNKKGKKDTLDKDDKLEQSLKKESGKLLRKAIK